MWRHCTKKEARAITWPWDGNCRMVLSRDPYPVRGSQGTILFRHQRMNWSVRGRTGNFSTTDPTREVHGEAAGLMTVPGETEMRNWVTVTETKQPWSVMVHLLPINTSPPISGKNSMSAALQA